MGYWSIMDLYVKVRAIFPGASLILDCLLFRWTRYSAAKSFEKGVAQYEYVEEIRNSGTSVAAGSVTAVPVRLRPAKFCYSSQGARHDWSDGYNQG